MSQKQLSGVKRPSVFTRLTYGAPTKRTKIAPLVPQVGKHIQPTSVVISVSSSNSHFASNSNVTVEKVQHTLRFVIVPRMASSSYCNCVSMVSSHRHWYVSQKFRSSNSRGAARSSLLSVRALGNTLARNIMTLTNSSARPRTFWWIPCSCGTWRRPASLEATSLSPKGGPTLWHIRSFH